MEQKINLDLNGKRYVSELDVTLIKSGNIKIGSILFVVLNGDSAPEVSLCEISGSEKYLIAWIAPSEWVLLLQRARVPNPAFVDSVYVMLNGLLEKNIIDKALQVGLNDIPLNRQYISKKQRESRYNLIETIVDRLILIKSLIASNLGPHQAGIVIYLLFTCFDRLGQVKGEKFAVHAAFNHFLHEVLPPNVRKMLLNSIIIEKVSLPPDMSKITYAGVDEKENYIFSMRNLYTHQGDFVPGEVPKSPDGWLVLRQNITGDHLESVYLNDWPYVLIHSVVYGLANYLWILAGQVGQRPDEQQQPDLPKGPLPQFKIVGYMSV